MTHPNIPHPSEFLAAERRFWLQVNKILVSTLGSNVVFALCFLVPLVAIPASDTVKLIVALVFSNWFQAWALPVLQKGQALADVQRSAKADADHQALTHLASKLDAIQDQLIRMEDSVRKAGPPSPP